MTTYAKRKLKYSRNEHFNLLHYVELDRIVTQREHKRTEGYVIISILYFLFCRVSIVIDVHCASDQTVLDGL